MSEAELTAVASRSADPAIASGLARDAVHAAVGMNGGFEALCSYDRDFDRIAGLVRREPDEY